MRKALFIILALVLLAMPAFAQGAPAATSGVTSNWYLAGIALGIAVAMAAFGQSRVASAACDGLARNPSARPGIQLALILGLAFIESLVLFIWVMILIKA